MATGPFAADSLLRDAGADTGVLVRRGPHQRDVRVVSVEQTVFESGGDGLRRVEVRHVERAGGHHLRNPLPACRGETVGSGAEEAPDVLVRELGGRDVQHAGNDAFADQRLHGLSAIAGRVKDQHLTARALQRLTRALDARRRHAEHRRGHQRFVVRLRFRSRIGHEARHRPGRLREHFPAHAVDAENVHHRVEHEDVFVAHELPHRAGGERAHHHFRDAERQRPHGRRGDRRPRRSAQTKDARHFAPRVRLPCEPCRACGGLRHGLATVGSRPHRVDRRLRQLEDPLSRHIGSGRRRPEGADIDEGDGDAPRCQEIANEVGLAALRVERGEEEDGRHQAVAHYSQQGPRRAV